METGRLNSTVDVARRARHTDNLAPDELLPTTFPLDDSITDTQTDRYLCKPVYGNEAQDLERGFRR